MPQSNHSRGRVGEVQSDFIPQLQLRLRRETVRTLSDRFESYFDYFGRQETISDLVVKGIKKGGEKEGQLALQALSLGAVPKFCMGEG